MAVSEDITGTLRSKDHGHPPCVMVAAGFCTEPSAHSWGIGWKEETSPTLKAVVPAVLTIDRASFNQGENAQYDFRIGDNGIMPTLVAKGPHAVLNSSGGGVAGTLDASYYKGQGERTGKEREYVVTDMVARRLTPRECERLQGFPDDWTLYGADDEVISDAQRYRALGNSVALPCVEFVLGKIKEEEK